MSMRRQTSIFSLIPQEILLDIFIRLGIKDIGRCRCVSKSWCHILSDQDFIRVHLIRLEQDNEFLLFECDHSNTLFTGTIARQSSGDFTIVANELTFDMSPPKSWTAESSCGGLILFVKDDNMSALSVVNPTMKEVLELRVPSHYYLDFITINTSRNRCYGLGYDHVNDDYKVVVLTGYFLKYEVKMFVNVYSVKKRTWKHVETLPYFLNDDNSGVFVGGSIHWITTNYWENSPFIAGFDLTEEKIWKVPAPRAIFYGESCKSTKLILLGGCLSMCPYPRDDEVNIWMMKEYGVMESWTKFRIVAEQDMIPYMGVPGRPELLLLVLNLAPDERYMVYNLDTAKFQDITIKGLKGGELSWGQGFRETLVSPNYNYATKRC